MLKSLYVEKCESAKKKDTLYNVLYADVDGRKVCVSFERSVIIDLLDISPSKLENLQVGDKLYVYGEQKNEKAAK